MSPALTYTRFEQVRALRNFRFFAFSLVFPLLLFFMVAGANRHEHIDGVAFPLSYMTGMAAWGTMAAVIAGGAAGPASDGSGLRGLRERVAAAGPEGSGRDGPGERATAAGGTRGAGPAGPAGADGAGGGAADPADPAAVAGAGGWRLRAHVPAPVPSAAEPAAGDPGGVERATVEGWR